MRRIYALLMLILVFFRELWNSSVAVLQLAFSRQPDVDPAIIEVPLRLRSEAAIVTLANLITLTPGTTSLHVSADRKSLYIHCLQAQDADAVLEGIRASFERWLLVLEG